jgi:FAD/FMN-containing dehydrogenase
MVPRGSGHSYGDMVLNDGHVLLDMRAMSRVLDWDPATGRMVVEPGVQILEVYRRAHAELFYLPASPSEGTITVAGAIANNINGKDSWRAGNFGDQVLSLKLMLASGEIITLDRERDRERFLTVVSGMGMLGIIVEATLQLRRIETPYLETSRVEARNVDDLLAMLQDAERDSDFVVVWLDVYARGSHCGRSVVHRTRWLKRDLPQERIDADVRGTLSRLKRQRQKAIFLHGLLNYVTTFLLHGQRLWVRLFNRLYFVFCALRNRVPRSQQELFLEYIFYPNLQIPPAAMVCGPHGYTIQIVFARDDAGTAIREMIAICQAMPCPPVTTVMRIHKSDDAVLSFSADGYSLNFEFHPKARHRATMREHIDALIECTIRHGGRVHLAKDSVLRPDQFERLFPRWREFLETKRQLDPERRFSSNMFRRLFPRLA